MACFTHILSNSTLLCNAAALGVAAATPALGEGPCTPHYAPVNTVAQVHSDGHIERQGIGDFDGDGWADLLVTRLVWQTTDAFEISILLNDPENGLRDATLELFDGPITKPISGIAILLEDFNGDGRLDAFIADSGMDKDPFPGAQNRLVLSTPEGKLRDATADLPQQVAYTHSATAADIDGDGDIDIFLGNLWNFWYRPHFLVNDGTGAFTRDFERVPAQFVDPKKHSYTAVFLADLNADEFPDLVLGDGSYWDGGPSHSYVLLNDGHGRFNPVKTPLPSSAFAPGVAVSGFDVAVGFAAADIDGDGNTDLLVHSTTADWRPRDIQLLLGNGDGTFRDETDARLSQNRNGMWMHWAGFMDLNHDGYLDIVGEPLGEQKLFYLNDGTGNFVQWESPFWIGNMAILDVNRDGKLDILSISQASPDVNMLEDYDLMTFLSCR